MLCPVFSSTVSIKQPAAFQYFSPYPLDTCSSVPRNVISSRYLYTSKIILGESPNLFSPVRLWHRPTSAS